jgi:hypothetical protein
MTKTTGKRNHGPVLVAALTVLGASLGASTPAGAASDTTGLFLKGHDTTTSKQHKGEIELQSFTVKHQAPTTGTQIKGEAPSAMFLKHNAVGSTQIKGETTSNQYKEHAPSAIFMKFDAPASNQIKGETTSTQQKGAVQSNQHKMNAPGGIH